MTKMADLWPLRFMRAEPTDMRDVGGTFKQIEQWANQIPMQPDSMTNAQRLALTLTKNPVVGYSVYVTDLQRSYLWNGTTWICTGWYGLPALYTPAIAGGWTLGNGSASGWYMKVGRWVTGFGQITFGSTSTYGAGEPTFTLPDTPDSTYSNDQWFRTNSLVSLVDNSGAGHEPGVLYAPSGSTVKVLWHNATATPLTGAILSNTAPQVWTTSDAIRFGFRYWSTTF